MNLHSLPSFLLVIPPSPSCQSSIEDLNIEDRGRLSNVSKACFLLGSLTYPNFKKANRLSNESTIRNKIVREVNASTLSFLHSREQQIHLASEIANQSDQGVVLLLYTAVEQTMRKTLESLFVDDNALQNEIFESGSAPLNTSSARRMLLQALGVIGKGMASDIRFLAKIRNEFAHHIFDDKESSSNRVSFTNQRISQWCKQLIIPQIYLFSGTLTLYYPSSHPTNVANLKIQITEMPSRSRYINTAKQICLLLEMAASSFGRMQQPSSKCNYDLNWANAPYPGSKDNEIL